MYSRTLPIALAVLSLVSCRRGTVENESNSYRTLTVQAEDRRLLEEFSARLDGRQVVELRPQVSGQITDIRIEEGRKVKKGQVLFVIDRVPYQAALDEATADVKSAEAQLASARLELESTQLLFDSNVVREYDLNMAKIKLSESEAALAQAKAKEASARNNLSYTEVKSPVNGVAGMIAYRVGALVGSSISEPLVTLSDDSTVYAYFSMDENSVSELVGNLGSSEGLIERLPEVELRLSNGKIYGMKGRINAISGIVDAGTGSVTLRADFPNPDGALRCGGSASVIIPSVLEQVIVIPQTATYELQNRTFVYKVVDGRTQSAPVTVYRLNDGKEYVVEEGLEDGDVIIAEGAGLVKEGAVVDFAKE